MDRKLIDLLVCPMTHQPLEMLDQTALAALNRAIGQGGVLRSDGSPRTSPLQQGLVTRDRTQVYPVEDGIPVLLAEEAIASHQADGFGAA
ncbi:MAG: Trm112 family protein [Pseudomonadota bacterium]|nr:Trm112 family protein [Pseudomonadota bacterium]